MITNINKIRNFGVFADYQKPVDIEPFSELNLIYGWNYSGKTTISRLLRTLEEKELHSGYPAATFNLTTDSGNTITETTLQTNSVQTRVFNPDFVEANLRWDGEAFEPILLLGDESIEAQKEIQKNENLIERLREGYRNKSALLKTRDEALSNEKTKYAKSIRKTLHLVETYTATHLNKAISFIKGSLETYRLADDERTDLESKATANDSDKLPEIQSSKLSSTLSTTSTGLAALLARKPAMANTIQYLVDHTDIASWVKDGLHLHETSSTCEFCGNGLTPERMSELRAHFSKDLEKLESELKQAKASIGTSRLNYQPLHQKDFYPEHRDKLLDCQKSISDAIAAHNSKIDELESAINEKLHAPFESVVCPTVDDSLGIAVCNESKHLEELIQKNNDITSQFSKIKIEAIEKLKNHYASEFCLEQRVEAFERVNEIIQKYVNWYAQTGKSFADRNAELEATISQAQKGREELNGFIDKFLSGSNIAIEVTKVGESERFRLVRGSSPAANLSEGEKTAIAFAFFLIKLKESQNMEDLVVYIDDPVSSLDSNHLFQLNAVLREFFFWKDSADGGKWKLTVEQLFLATHNFEFLGLIRELPISKQRRKYYFVSRVSPTQSSLVNMPDSIIRYSSEYQYLWSVIHAFHTSADKTDITILLALPNAVRRFIELYTYAKVPSGSGVSVDVRAQKVFGSEESKRILKVLHYFSHSNNIVGVSRNSDLLCDIENVVAELVAHIQLDTLHHEALMDAIS